MEVPFLPLPGETQENCKKALKNTERPRKDSDETPPE
jgi:hypothetical protein